MTRFVTLLLLLASLCACTVGPEYRPPEIEAPPRFVSQEVLEVLSHSQGPEAAFDVAWWKGFQDPLLDRLVKRGLENNLDIGVATARLREASVDIERAEAGDSPRVTAEAGPSAEYGYEFEPADDDVRSRGVDGSLDVAIPLDVFGRTRRRVQAAQAAQAAAEAQLRSLVLQVSTDIVREYLELRGNQRQLELLLQSVDLQEQTLAIVRARYESGLAPELDVQRAITSVQRLVADVPPLEQELLTSRNRLAVLAGEFPGFFEADLSTTGPLPVFRGPIPESLPLSVLRRRPEIAESEARLREAVAEIGIAEAELYPSLELTSGISLGAATSNGDPIVSLITGSLGAAIEHVIYDGGVRRADINAAQARAEAALLEYRGELLSAVEEVEQSLSTLAASRASQAALERAFEASSRSFSQAETLYQQGLISFLDVVDAQRVLADVQQELAEEQTDYTTELANLFRTLGVETPAINRERTALPIEER